jgi:hypothetical protein
VGMRRILFALVILSMSATGFAADVEDTKPPAEDGKASAADTTSYFTGVWAGKWPWGVDGVEFTVTVGKRSRNGMFGTSYAWESGRFRTGTPMKPGSLKAWGKEQGDRFLIEWKNKDGVKFSITLAKGNEDSVKATFDTDGSFPISDLSQRVTTLKRK